MNFIMLFLFGYISYVCALLTNSLITMKKSFLFAFLLITVTAFAQNKFIEVEVTDTITLKPLNFQVNVYVMEQVAVDIFDEDRETAYDALAEKEKEKNKLQQVKAMVEAQKYKVKPLDESRFNAFERRYYGSEGQEGFTVLVDGLAAVKKLKEQLDNNEDVRSSVIVLKYADELKAEEQLIKKLLDKAKARAGVIGVNS